MDSNFCYKDDNRDRYTFYKHIDKYLQYDSFCIKDTKCHKYKGSCNFFGTAIHGYENLIDICAKFKYLINDILETTQSTDSILDEFHFEYINYWLNDQLNINNQIICPKDFLQHMRTKDNRNKTLRKLDRKLDYIERDELKNMKALFYMYKHYYAIKDVIAEYYPIESSAMSYANNCVEKYRELKVNCTDVSTPFCKALNNFAHIYENTDLNIEKLHEWKHKKLPLLNKDVHAHAENINPLKSMNSFTEPGKSPAVVSSTSSTTFNMIPEEMVDDVETRVITLATSEKDPRTGIGSLESMSSFTSTVIPGSTDELQEIGSEESEKTEIKSLNDFNIPTNKIIGTSISTVGVSSLFFLFYKFTSLGSRFRSQNKNKKYIRNNFDQQSNNILDTSEYQYTTEESMSYNISYNSV
ncbi:Plasmodium vivax Vir protein, putative [Plasmodium vivax]|uniref:Vir protein, putative n=1 Tax=Plasmodium vivax TaxID=5855 RepID=A0A1G4EDI5_PLAVI|nr:Plasmodium vivax Vir protein, putative [Plasmodium vivax]